MGKWSGLGPEHPTSRWGLEDDRQDARWPPAHDRASLLPGPTCATSDHRLEDHDRRAGEVPGRELRAMSQQDAEYYQAHKDDPEEWGEPQPAPKSRRRRLVAMISVRFTADEEQAVRRAARKTGDSVSNFIRQATLR